VSSSTVKSVRSPSQDIPAGASASFGSSAAQHWVPLSSPRYRHRIAADPNQLWFSCNGSLAHAGRARTRGSSEGRSSGPISTSSWSPRKTNQWPSPGASHVTQCSKSAGRLNGSGFMR
jgi:hypothetical protein